MRVYGSIHTAYPAHQAEHEGAYKGYKRIVVESGIGHPFLRVVFPEIEEDTNQIMTYVAIGTSETGHGEITMVLPIEPHIPLVKMQPGKSPNIVMLYPEDLPEAHRLIHQLVVLGKVKTEELEPRFFEAANASLEACGIPIMTVQRYGAATWNVKMSAMPSLRTSGIEGAA